jgi:hypothetical protein
VDIFPSLRISPLAGFGGQEKILSVPGHPGADEDFRITVTRGGIDMVHPVLQKDFQNPIRVFLAGPYQGGPSEDRRRAHVAGAAKRSFFDQFPISWSIRFYFIFFL